MIQAVRMALPAALIFSTSLQADTLQDVVQRTLQSNPDVLITTNNRLAADQRLQQARGGYLPSVDLQLGYGRENSENATTRFRGLVTGEDDITLTRKESSLSLRQMVFDGFNVRYDVRRRRAEVSNAAHQVSEASESVALRAAEVYLDIFRRENLLELAKDNLVVHQKILDQIEVLMDSGAGRKADLKQAEGRLALAKSNLVDAQGRLRDTRYNYLRVTGEPAEGLEKPEVEAIRSQLPASLEAALDDAVSMHPRVRAAESRWEAARATRKQARSTYLPRIDLELEASHNDNLDGIIDENNDVSAMLRLRYNVYRGGADRARRRETANLVQAARESANRARRIVEEEVRLAWNSLITIQERLEHLQQHVKSSEEVLDAYRQQFKLGQRSLLDVLDSENELFNARSSLRSAEYAEMFSMYRVLGGQGKLLSVLGVKKSDQAMLGDN